MTNLFYKTTSIENFPGSFLLRMTCKGLICGISFEILRRQVQKEFEDASSLLLDMREIVCIDGELNCTLNSFSSHDYPPVAVIVNLDQVNLWCSYAIASAAHGVVIAVFTEEEDALTWAADRAFVFEPNS